MSEIKVKYSVHSTNRQLVSAEAIIGEKKGSVLVDGLAVQLVPKDAHHGSLTMNFFGDELATAQELFKQDATVELTIK